MSFAGRNIDPAHARINRQGFCASVHVSLQRLHAIFAVSQFDRWACPAGHFARNNHEIQPLASVTSNWSK